MKVVPLFACLFLLLCSFSQEQDTNNGDTQIDDHHHDEGTMVDPEEKKKEFADDTTTEVKKHPPASSMSDGAETEPDSTTTEVEEHSSASSMSDGKANSYSTGSETEPSNMFEGTSAGVPDQKDDYEVKDNGNSGEGNTDKKSYTDGKQVEAIQEKVVPGAGLYKDGAELIMSLSFEDKTRGYEILIEASSEGNLDAKELLAYGYLYGNVLRRNFTKSHEIFVDLANKGHPSGQQGLGLLYSTGISVNSSQAKAILYYTFGALGGHPQAQMAMGYRSLLGVGVPQSCETSLSYYAKVAATVAESASVFAGGHAVQKARISDEEEEPGTIFAGVTEDELEHYRDVFADTGAQFSLGLYYLFGLGGVERNLPQALELLKRANTPAALALIGRIYAEGSPPQIKQDYETAIKYFKRAIDQKSAEGYTGLGIMYYKGMGIEKDYRKALEMFQRASDKGSNEASLYIGLANLFGFGTPINANRALSSFKAAAQGGHILAIYYMGEIYANGLTGRKNCKQAVELFKAVAERGRWSRLLREAHKTYLGGDTDSALMMYLHLGELGVEVAQSNAAYILHEGNSDLLERNESLKRALMLWSRSATQGYSIARVMLGDYYYYGFGTEPDMELAVDQYRIASDKLSNPQAMFNLGYMYENGIGLQQDFHLAKRYYDLAASTTTDAAVPVYLALLKLSVLSYWHTVSKEYSSYQTLQSAMTTLWNILDQWDIYLIAILCVVLAIAVRWHRRLH